MTCFMICLLLAGCGVAGGVCLVKNTQIGSTGFGEWCRKRLQG